jgi:hypothetical protein
MARTTTKHDIVVKSAKYTGLTQDEDVGTGSKIYPGHLLEKTGNGMRLHPTAGGYAAPLFAGINPSPDTDTYAGSSSLQTAFAKGDTVRFYRCQPGDIIQARIKQSESTTIGRTFLDSDGAGHLKSIGTELAGGTSNPVALAWESVTTAGSAALIDVLIV